MVSSATTMILTEARKNKNEFEVKLNISLQAKRNRTYPEIEVVASVKIMRRKGISEKERTSHWNKTPETVKRIDKKLGQSYFFLDAWADASRGSQTRNDDNKGYLRHELLKV